MIFNKFNEYRAYGAAAGAEGFEPSGVLAPLVFKTSAFGRSAMPPRCIGGSLYAVRLCVEPLEGPSRHDTARGGGLAERGRDAPYLVVSAGGASCPVVAVPVPGPQVLRVAVAVELVATLGGL